MEVYGLTKRFGSFTAVDNVTLKVREGEIFGLLGPNGAGKTTMMLMITSLIEPTEGEAFVNGYSIKDKNSVRKSIGVVFQDPTIDDRLTAYENLDFHAKLYGMEKKIRKERIASILKLVELYDKKDWLVRKYSGGMRRRLEIARGLLHRPKVLFLDEPTLGLDAQTRRRIWDYIKMLNEEGITIFLMTHYMEEADRLCNRIAIMNRGRIVALDSPDGLKSSISQDIITISFAYTDHSTTEYLREFSKIIEDEFNSAVEVDMNSEKEGIINIRVRKGEEKLPEIMEMAVRQPIKIKKIELKKPSLDDVFIHYTGKALRDEETDGYMQMIKQRMRRGT